LWRLMWPPWSLVDSPDRPLVDGPSHHDSTRSACPARSHLETPRDGGQGLELAVQRVLTGTAWSGVVGCHRRHRGGRRVSDEPEGTGRVVAQVRERFLASDNLDSPEVRERILASWRRSQFYGVSVDELAPPYRPETETDSRLVRAARPVLDRLESALADAPMSVILTDAHGCVLDRRCGEPALIKQLDAILLAPGFS